MAVNRLRHRSASHLRRAGTITILALLIGGTSLTVEANANTAGAYLQVSTLQDRSGPVPLDGSHLSGHVAIFVQQMTNTKTVTFYLDGAGTPLHVESFAPYDLAGTATDGTAKLFDVAGWTPGTHHLTAIATSTTGASPITLQAAFTVGNAAERVVTVCGSQLCMNGTPWRDNGGATNGNPSGSQTADGNMALAVDLQVNTIRLTDFIPKPGVLGTSEYSESVWSGVDGMIARASKNGLKVELDLATYRNYLQSQSSTFNPYTYDWTRFLTFVANRINTVTGKRYGSDTTIAFVSFAGEMLPPSDSDSKTRGVTAQDLIDFCNSVQTTWGRLAPGQVRIPGGLFHLNDATMPWRQIFALPSTDLPATHSYSTTDESLQPTVNAYVKSLGKPWLLEEFGFNTTNYPTDSTRASAFNRQYDLALKNGAAGVSWWNINPDSLNTTNAPITAAAIRLRNVGLAAKR